MLFGHADATGDDVHNKHLTDRRAQAVFALLTQDLEMLDSVARADGWALPQYRRMLDALGVTGSAERTRVQRFQRQYNADLYHRGSQRERAHTLQVDGVLGPRTEAALRDAYLTRVPVVLDPARFFGPKTAGCAAFNPIGADAPNRRVALALYRPDFPTESKIPCRRGDAASCKINKKAQHPWQCNFYRRTLDGEHAAAATPIVQPATERLLQLQDAHGQVLANHPYELMFADGEVLQGTSDGGGWVDLPIEEGTSCRLRVGEVTYALRLASALSELEERQSRLNALGFEAGRVSGKLTKGTDRASFRFRESIGASDDDTNEQLLAQLRTDAQGVA